jgi:multidrug efflux system membrane fusion protein
MNVKALGLPEPEERSAPKTGTRRWGLWLMALLVPAAAGIWLLARSGPRESPTAAGSRPAAPSVPVVAAAVRQGDMPLYLTGLGSVTAFNTVAVKSRVDGQIVKIAFQEGQVVREGDLLAEIDPRPFEVQLNQAEGQLARDSAQLRDAKINLERYRQLVEQKFIATQQLDDQEAQVGQYEGTIKIDQAQIENAKLQLTYSRITAPISGRIGLRLVDVGNVVHANDQNGLLVITQVEPIAVVFTTPEDDLPPVLKKLRAGEHPTVDAYDRAGREKLASGELLSVDNQIDQSTGTTRLKAVFANQDEVLFPNQFVNVRLLLDVRKDVSIVPSAAIQRGPQGTFVYVIKPDETVEVRPVKPGPALAADTSIEDGLSAGEMVVVDGVDKLRPGSKVQVKAAGAEGAGRRSSG